MAVIRKRDAHFSRERPDVAKYAGRCHCVPHSSVGCRTSKHVSGYCYSAGRARELRGHIKQHIPELQLSKPIKSQSYCWVEMASGLFAPRRLNDRDHRRTNQQSHDGSTDNGGGDKVADRGSGMLQQCGEHTNKEHVQPKFAGFHHVLLPVMAQTHHSFGAFPHFVNSVRKLSPLIASLSTKSFIRIPSAISRVARSALSK
jgi:hypothetical protein